MHTFRLTVSLLAIGVILSTSSAALAQGSDARVAVVATPHFAFHSDFATNLHDALLEAGRARNKMKPELFQAGAEATCFNELPKHVQVAWFHAVNYYAEIVSPETWAQRQQYSIRVDLSGVEERDDPEDRRIVGIARSFRGAAAPAYEPVAGRLRTPRIDSGSINWSRS